MMTGRLKRTSVAMVLVTFVGCGGGPSPAPSPVATLSLQSAEVPSFPNIFYLSDRGETSPGQIAVDVNARFVNRGVDEVRGTIHYDNRLLQIVNLTEGEWMNQGGARTQFSVTHTNGGVAIRVERATSATTPAIGSGVILTLRFRPVPGVTAGDSLLLWTDAYALFRGTVNQLVGAFGGTILIR